MKPLWVLWLGILMRFCLAGHTQTDTHFRIGGGLQGIWLRGDLSAGDDTQTHGGAIALTVELNSAKTLRPQLNVVFGSVTAQYRLQPQQSPIQPNSFVDTRFVTGYLLLQAHLWKNRRVHPLLGIGMGVLGFTPRDAAGNSLSDQLDTRLDTESYGTTTAVVPLSAGVTAELVGRWHVQLRYQYWLTFSDYLDNVGELGTQSGNDGFQVVALAVQLDL